jgi:hypothetical protein
MRDGDTLGLWTYDEELHTGFPMQVWSNQDRDDIIQTVSNSLAGARYQAKPHLEKVLPAARQLIEQSRVITLIFIYDGLEIMQGTGFDQDINDLQMEFGRQVRADNIPFVTVLSARDGKVFDYRVRTPSSVSLPQTANFFDPARTNAAPTQAPATLPSPAVVVPQPPAPRGREVVLRPPPPETNPPPITATNLVEPVPPDNTHPVPQTGPAPAVPPLVGESTNHSPATNPLALNPNLNPNPNPVIPSIAASATGSSNPQSAIRNPQSPLPVASPPVPPVMSTTIPPPPNDYLAPVALVISAAAVAVALILMFIRRPRADSSIITKSMDHRP